MKNANEKPCALGAHRPAVANPTSRPASVAAPPTRISRDSPRTCRYRALSPAQSQGGDLPNPERSIVMREALAALTSRNFISSELDDTNLIDQLLTTDRFICRGFNLQPAERALSKPDAIGDYAFCSSSSLPIIASAASLRCSSEASARSSSGSADAALSAVAAGNGESSEFPVDLGGECLKCLQATSQLSKNGRHQADDGRLPARRERGTRLSEVALQLHRQELSLVLGRIRHRCDYLVLHAMCRMKLHSNGIFLRPRRRR